MKIIYHDNRVTNIPVTEEITSLSLKESIEKTRLALEIAYSGFNNATDIDLIDSYIYEITALQKRYEHLSLLAAQHPEEEKSLNSHSSVRTLISHVFG